MNLLSFAVVSYGGHPSWHYGVAAAVGFVVFVGVKVRERLAHPSDGAGVAPDPWPRPTPLVALVAAASAGAAGVHALVGPEHFREAAVFGVFMAAAAALQGAWAVLLLRRPSERLLLAAVIGNGAVVAIWAVSRTTGMPIGATPWVPELITAKDAVATALELVIEAGALWLLTHHGTATASRRALLRPLTPRARG
jgi:hypothetical protein